jgi:cysteine desulfurase
VQDRTAGYFDAAAGLPLCAVAVEALQAAAADGWADPARLTGPGRRSAVLLDAAREAVAEELRVRPDEVSFVPSGVHALHLAALGTLAGRHRAGNRLVHSAVEHSAVFKAADWHQARGGEVEVVGVDDLGRVDVEQFLAAAARPGVAAAALQAANHEVGTRQPIDLVGRQLRDTGVPLIVDAAQEVLYGEPPAEAPVFTTDARLWGGPADVGLLVIRRGTRWQSPFPTDESENGHSAGVVNVAAAVAAAASLRAFRLERIEQGARLHALIETVRSAIPASVPDLVVLGDPDDRLPHLVTFSCLYVDGQTLLDALDRQGFAVSSGSSCTSDTLTPSHVLVAMGALTSGNVRISLHPSVTDDEVQRFLEVFPSVIAEVRAQAPGSPPPTNDLGAFPTPQHRNTPKQPAPKADGSAAKAIIDSRGRRCPLPILDLARAIGGVDIGSELSVLADDPAATTDIPAWCRMSGQELLGTSSQGGGATRYRVRRLA